jgi:hypothetical protein
VALSRYRFSLREQLPRSVRVGLVLTTVCLGFLVLLQARPIAIGPTYHAFADQRRLLGIANAFNVLSNVPFTVVGLWGVSWLKNKKSRSSFILEDERLPYFIFFGGVFLTGLGSFWYHLAPTDARLPWDLVPMTCSFMSMTAIVIQERINVRIGLWLTGPLLAAGIASVAFWYFTEMRGHGDYRFYLFVQLFPPVLLAVIVALFPPRYTQTELLVTAFLTFVLAKVMELADGRIYSLGGVVSGHSLKHVTAAGACFCILKMIKHRHSQDPKSCCALSSRRHPKVPFRGVIL